MDILFITKVKFCVLTTLEEILSISTGLATRPSRLSPKKCINKSIWLATGGAPSMGTPRVPSGCQQIDLFMHFLGARVLMASVEMDKSSSSVLTTLYITPQKIVYV